MYRTITYLQISIYTLYYHFCYDKLFIWFGNVQILITNFKMLLDLSSEMST